MQKILYVLRPQNSIPCLECANERLGYESITQSSLLAPVLRVDRSLLVKPTQSSHTARHTTPGSSPTLIVEIPDSVEQHTKGNDMETENPPPIQKKATLPQNVPLISDKTSYKGGRKHTSRPLW